MMHDKKKNPSRSVKAKLGVKEHLNEHRTDRLKGRQGLLTRMFLSSALTRPCQFLSICLYIPVVEKKWLATHIWHAKRTKMVDIWGFRLV